MRRREFRSLAIRTGFLALLAVNACEQPTEPARFPSDAIAFDPAPIYAEWWSLVDACTGRVGILGDISWYHTAEPSGLIYNGRSYAGLYFAEGHRVLLDRQNILSGETVRHEMIHALAAPSGHPRALFSEQCAHLQRCLGCGHEEADRGVLSSALEFNASVLEVTISAEPALISAAASDRWYRLVVAARNTRDDAVWVRLPGEASFGWLEVGRSGSYAFTDETRWAFRAGETRRYTFDLRDTVGTYYFYGNFGGKRSDTIAVNIAP